MKKLTRQSNHSSVSGLGAPKKKPKIEKDQADQKVSTYLKFSPRIPTRLSNIGLTFTQLTICKNNLSDILTLLIESL